MTEQEMVTLAWYCVRLKAARYNIDMLGKHERQRFAELALKLMEAD